MVLLLKILGLILTWNNLSFFKCSLEQALDFCDEVIIAEGCHYKKYAKRSTDGTAEYLEKFKDHPKLKILDFEQNDRNDIVQLKLRMKAIKISSYFKSGNWVIQWDDDDFFFKKDLSKIRVIMEKTKYDTLVFNERRFIYNFRFNCFKKRAKGRMNIGGIQIDRITSGAKFKALIGKKTHPRLFYKDGKKYDRIKYLKDIVLFHYAYVKPSLRMKARWEMSIERGYPNEKERIKKFISIKWNDKIGILSYKKELEEFMKKKRFNIYNGQHPKVLDNHPWRYINDVRDVDQKYSNLSYT